LGTAALHKVNPSYSINIFDSITEQNENINEHIDTIGAHGTAQHIIAKHSVA
jgi:hypothetical protein